jgi:hypothetical protein
LKNVAVKLGFACLAALAVALGCGVWWGLYHRPSSPSPTRAPSNEVSTLSDRLIASSTLTQLQTGAAQIPQSMPATVPGSLRFILGGDGRSGYAQRVKALHAIHRDLMPEEAETLSHYLLVPSKGAQNRTGENWLRNDIMDKLAQQSALPLGYPDVLAAIYQDPQQDPVMRDYALQYMPSVYDRANSVEKSNLGNALWQAVKETNGTIAGTALLALLDISGGSDSSVASDDTTGNGTSPDSTVGRAQLAQTALKLVSDDRGGELSRITAVQVCGRMQVEQALPVMEQLAQTAPSIPLRIAATAALGDLGDPAATDTLQSLVVSADPRQTLAAQSALNRLTRTQTAAGSVLQAGSHTTQ